MLWTTRGKGANNDELRAIVEVDSSENAGELAACLDVIVSTLIIVLHRED